MSHDRRDLERELSRHLADAAPAPRPDAASRVRARAAATSQRGAWVVRMASALRSPEWARAGALAAVATAALLVGIYIGQVGLPIQAGPSGSPSADADPSAATSDAQAWVEPAAYSYVLDSSCGERMLIGRFRITVAGGVVTDAQALLDPWDILAVQYPTLGDLLAELDAARRSGAFVATVVSDPVDGHPVEIVIDHDEQTVDDEACYRISEYRPAGEASPGPQPTAPTAMSFAVWERFDMPDPAPGVFGGGTPRSVVAFGGGYLAVGTRLNNCCAGQPSESDGIVWTSADGGDWRLVDTGDTFAHATLHRVVVAGSRLLATGWFAEPGEELQVAAAWVSSDGLDWERVPDPAPSWVVVADDGLLLGAADVTTGPAASVSFLRSTDGLTWAVAEVQPEMERVTAATESPDGGGAFMGPVQGEPPPDGSPTFDVQAWTTRDGVTWNGAIAAQDATIRGVAAWNDGFVAVGSRPGELEGTALDIGVIWASPDGLTWREAGSGVGIEESIMTGVFRVGEALVAVAECCGGDAVLRPTAWVSEDGAIWTSVPHQPAFEGWEIQVHGMVETPDGLLAVGRRWDQESNHPVPQAWIASDEPMVWLEATSEPGAEIGTEYEFRFGHCGLQSPIDFDGSLWVMSGSDSVTPPVPLDMLVGTMRLTGSDTAVFEDSASNWTMGFVRHEGPRAYPLCD